jgi:hypothetical protein
LFRDYVDDLYNRRIESKKKFAKMYRDAKSEHGWMFEDERGAANAEEAQQASEGELESWHLKLKLNSLYGKFGMCGTSSVMAPDNVLPQGQQMNEGWSREDEENRTAVYSNFIWASYITSGARCRLHEFLVKYDALYTDTDSVFTQKEIDKGEEGSGLGALSLESRCDWVDIRAPKVYQTSTDGRLTVKVKGVPKHAIPKSGLPKPGEEGDTTFRYKKVTRFTEANRRHIAPNTWMWIEKGLTLQNDKRRFKENGDSEPWDVDQIIKGFPEGIAFDTSETALDSF